MESLVRQLYELPGKVVTLHDGEYLFHEGDPAKYFYIVRSGHIFITKYASSGRVLSLRLASRSSIIGELPLYQAEPAYIFNAVAQCPSEVYAIEFPVLQSYLEKRPQLAVNLLKIISNHMRKQHSKFRDLLLYGKKGGAVLHAHPPGQQLWPGRRRRRADPRAADEPGTGQLLRHGPGKPEPHAR